MRFKPHVLELVLNLLGKKKKKVFFPVWDGAERPYRELLSLLCSARQLRLASAAQCSPLENCSSSTSVFPNASATLLFFYFFLPQMLLELCWLTCIWRSSALPPWVTQQASPLILIPTDKSTPRHRCCRGSDLSFGRWRQGPRWLGALLAAGSEGVAVCFRSDPVPGPNAGRLLYKWPGGVNRLLYRSVLSPWVKVKFSVAFQLQWAPHPKGPAGFDGGC